MFQTSLSLSLSLFLVSLSIFPLRFKLLSYTYFIYAIRLLFLLDFANFAFGINTNHHTKKKQQQQQKNKKHTFQALLINELFKYSHHLLLSFSRSILFLYSQFYFRFPFPLRILPPFFLLTLYGIIEEIPFQDVSSQVLNILSKHYS